METTERYAQKKIIDKMMDLQLQHNLPVNIIVGKEMEDLQQVIFEYELIDYYIVQWLINKATQHCIRILSKDIMAYHD